MNVRKIILRCTFIITVLFSCTPKKEETAKIKLPYEKVCTIFMDRLVENRISEARELMDPRMVEELKANKADSILAKTTEYLKSEFDGPINFVPITSEKTYQSDRQAYYNLFKIESPSKFGFISFYISVPEGEIILFSLVGSSKPKRF